jgi:signal transduction histidine kinase
VLSADAGSVLRPVCSRGGFPTLLLVSNPLRSLLDEPRPASAPARVWRDWVLLALVVVAAVVETAVREDLPLPWLSLLVTIGLAPTLLWRRTHPFAMVAVAFGVSGVVDLGLIIADAPALDSFTTIYFLLLPYALFRWGSGRGAVAGLAIILTSAAIGFWVSWTGLGDLIGGGAVLCTSFALGLAVRTQHGARHRRLEQVKAEERVDLARELHDTVAHHVSAIAIQAQAGRALAASSPASPVEALEVIEAEASRALAEMRAMVRVLRNEAPADYAPQAGVADLERLAGTSPVGPRVEVKLSGDLEALPAALDAAVFRIVQEAVTNALRHARNADLVDVHVDGDRSSVHVRVRDDGDHVPAWPALGTGFGITGMIERAALLGGECSAGPDPERGWVVEANLPREVAE